MAQNEYFDLGKTGGPLICVVVSCFDLTLGIRMLYKIDFVKDCPAFIDDLLKINMSNVHRQNEEFLLHGYCVYSSFDVFDCSVYNHVFIVPNKPKTSVYSVSMYFYSSILQNFSRKSFIFETNTRIIAQMLKNGLSRGEQPSKMGQQIIRLIEQALQCLNCSIGTSSKMVLDDSEKKLYSLALYSHLIGNSNTIIETTKIEIAQKMVEFLQSFHVNEDWIGNDTIQSSVNPFMNLQIISKTSMTPEQILIQYPERCVLIRLPESTVFLSPESEFQKSSNNEYYSILNEQSNKISYLDSIISRIHYECTSINHSITLINNTINRIFSTNSSGTQNKCVCAINDLIRLSIAVVSIIDEKLRTSGSTTLRPEQITDIMRVFSIPDRTDIPFILTIAAHYGQKVFPKFFTTRKDAIVQLLNIN